MTDKTKEVLKLALEALEENHHLIEEHERPEYLTQYDRVISAVVKALALVNEVDQEWPAQHECKFPLCHNEEYQQALAEQIKRELYTGEQAQRKPLTDEQIVTVAKFIDIEFKDEGYEQQLDDILTFARAIETAHGIKENT